jgi:hypothetical protein
MVVVEPKTKKPRRMPRLCVKGIALKNEVSRDKGVRDTDNRFTEITWSLPHQYAA